jgi:hypothetical protein
VLGITQLVLTVVPVNLHLEMSYLEKFTILVKIKTDENQVAIIWFITRYTRVTHLYYAVEHGFAINGQLQTVCVYYCLCQSEHALMM